MFETSIKYESVSSEDEYQIHYVEDAPHLKYMSLNKDNFEVANAYNLKLRKKKRVRTAFTTDQVLLLENTFSERQYIDKCTRKKLAKYLKISEKNVKVWFQNRRMKKKRLSSESSDTCEANDGEGKSNKSNDSGHWESPADSTVENTNNHVKYNHKNNEIEHYTPQFPYYGATNEHNYYTDQYQYNDVSCAYNTNPHYYEFNDYYSYNPIDYNYPVYNYNLPQYYTN